MRKRFFVAGAIIIGATALLIVSAVRESAKAVVTASSLLSQPTARKNVRLGARVADYEIQYTTTPTFELKFAVRDIQAQSTGAKAIPVIYGGIMPETLKIGRDVILEGDFDGSTFHAKSLLTQCPSKYEPPKAPGE